MSDVPVEQISSHHSCHEVSYWLHWNKGRECLKNLWFRFRGKLREWDDSDKSERSKWYLCLVDLFNLFSKTFEQAPQKFPHQHTKAINLVKDFDNIRFNQEFWFRNSNEDLMVQTWTSLKRNLWYISFLHTFHNWDGKCSTHEQCARKGNIEIILFQGKMTKPSQLLWPSNGS